MSEVIAYYHSVKRYQVLNLYQKIFINFTQMIHGTKKQQKNIKTEQELKDEEELSNKINSKLADFFHIRNKTFSDEDLPKYMEFTALLMQLCSDIPTIFNFRRQLLQRSLTVNHNDLKKQAEILLNQIKLITKLIRDDPKSYTLWSFRQWLVQNIYKLNKAIVTEEKQLCKLLLTKDEKNFHVWNYRNWINSVEFNIDEELLFTQEKIKSNPFNFSPYHFRSKYLPLKYSPLIQRADTSDQLKSQIVKYGMPKPVFDSELESIKTAIFLNPNEEAPWIYYRWLLKRILPAIVLLYRIENNKHSLIFNERIRNPSHLMKFETQFTTLTTESLSSVWTYSSDGMGIIQPPGMNQLVEIEGVQKLIVMRKDPRIDEIRQIYKTEEQFIRQILQQETACRFAYLQVLQLLKNQLFLTCSVDQRQRISSSGLQIFQKLDNQQKTKHYIQKLKEFWTRIKSNTNLTEQQAAISLPFQTTHQ